MIIYMKPLAYKIEEYYMYSQTIDHDVIVIGGGAAGYFAAINAQIHYPNKKIALLEKTSKTLSKVKISGGGRCNVTHACSSIPEMLKAYPRGARLLRTAFQQFFTQDLIEWFELRGVPLKTETDGRMFPVSNTSQTIIDCFENEMRRLNIPVYLKEEVIQLEKEENFFILTSKSGQQFKSKHTIVCSGGYPKGTQFSWLRNIGLVIDDPYPSLFTFNLPNHPITKLMGLSVQEVLVQIKSIKHKQTGPLLITHWGVSGPAILKLSAWAAKELANSHYQFDFTVNFLPDFHADSLGKFLNDYKNQNPKSHVSKSPFHEIPQRLWSYFLEHLEISLQNWADTPKKKLFELAELMTQYSFKAQGKTTFKEEFVTAGGVLTPQVDPVTLESKAIHNLYFAGECLNIDGITGGFNFQNAWTTAFIASKLGKKNP